MMVNGSPSSRYISPFVVEPSVKALQSGAAVGPSQRRALKYNTKAMEMAATPAAAARKVTLVFAGVTLLSSASARAPFGGG